MNILYLAFGDSPAAGYWDQALIADILKDPIFKKFDDKHGAFVVIPAKYQGQYIDAINAVLNKFGWVVLVLTSDEESDFPVEKINHKNIRIWVQYPKRGRHDTYRKLPLGYTTETRKNLHLVEKDFDIFYSGQKTHIRREQLSEALETYATTNPEKVVAKEDQKGFSQGFEPDQYQYHMNSAKIAPAPSGAVSQDSFRLYEALEAGAIPIADDIAPNGDSGFWDYLFGSVPFPVIKDYASLPGYVQDLLAEYPRNANQIQAWWIRKKREIRNQILDDYWAVSGETMPELTTVMIPISFIPSHPSTRILEETVLSVRHHLPDAEIILTFDGLRPEHKKYAADYEEFIRRALFLANTEWGPCYPILFDEHVHQIGMARVGLEHVTTELLLYVEQDTPLVTDEPIEWEKLEEAILTGESNMIRLHFEAFIPEPHEHLMIGTPENGLLKTVQWSQRPHLASTAFYRRIIDQHFSKDADCFLEDVLHGKLYGDWEKYGITGWNQWRVHIYHPNNTNIKRSLHLDGREGMKKYDDRQIF